MMKKTVMIQIPAVALILLSFIVTACGGKDKASEGDLAGNTPYYKISTLINFEDGISEEEFQNPHPIQIITAGGLTIYYKAVLTDSSGNVISSFTGSDTAGTDGIIKPTVLWPGVTYSSLGCGVYTIELSFYKDAKHTIEHKVYKQNFTKCPSGSGTTIGGGLVTDPDAGKVWAEATATGTTTTGAKFPPRHGEVVVFNDGTQDALWVIGGWDGTNLFNDVWKSTNGSDWNIVVDNTTDISRFSKRSSLAALVFNDGTQDALWVIAGHSGTHKNDVWKSTNGKDWKEVTVPASTRFPERSQHSAVVFNDGSGDAMWVIGGYNHHISFNDVWKSTNGSDWKEVTTPASARFPVRYNHTSVVFNNEIWVIAGWDRNGTAWTSKNDVWKSTNGIDWKPVTTTGTAPNTFFIERGGHAAVVSNDGTKETLWVIGGLDNTRLNDVWKSTNGTDWVLVTATATFSPRLWHRTVVFNKALWTIGGKDSIYLNEVWRSP